MNDSTTATHPDNGETATATCPVCGSAFVPNPDWFIQRKVYCSFRCRHVANSRRTKQRKRDIKSLMARLRSLRTVTSATSWTPDGAMVWTTFPVGSKAKSPPDIRFVDVIQKP